MRNCALRFEDVESLLLMSLRAKCSIQSSRSTIFDFTEDSFKCWRMLGHYNHHHSAFLWPQLPIINSLIDHRSLSSSKAYGFESLHEPLLNLNRFSLLLSSLSFTKPRFAPRVALQAPIAAAWPWHRPVGRTENDGSCEVALDRRVDGVQSSWLLVPGYVMSCHML